MNTELTVVPHELSAAFGSGYYKLVDKRVVVCSLDEWAAMFQNRDSRRVARSKKHGGKVVISTVFLGIDHGFGGTPQFFETMVSGGKDHEYTERYTTYEEAVKGHKRAVRRARG